VVSAAAPAARHRFKNIQPCMSVSATSIWLGELFALSAATTPRLEQPTPQRAGPADAESDPRRAARAPAGSPRPDRRFAAARVRPLDLCRSSKRTGRPIQRDRRRAARAQALALGGSPAADATRLPAYLRRPHDCRRRVSQGAAVVHGPLLDHYDIRPYGHVMPDTQSTPAVQLQSFTDGQSASKTGTKTGTGRMVFGSLEPNTGAYPARASVTSSNRSLISWRAASRSGDASALPAIASLRAAKRSRYSCSMSRGLAASIRATWLPDCDNQIMTGLCDGRHTFLVNSMSHRQCGSHARATPKTDTQDLPFLSKYELV
jgi:hypothetical protein